MRLDELMGSPQTFEMNMKYNKKEKDIAFQAGIQIFAEEEDIKDSGDLTDSLAMITGNFTNIMKKLNKTSLQVPASLISLKKGKILQIPLIPRRKVKESNVMSVRALGTFNPSVQIPLRKRVNHFILPGVMRNLKVAMRMMKMK